MKAVRLSFKCRVYEYQSHDPCSGTTDDGGELPCECWCHKAQKAVPLRVVTGDATRPQVTGPAVIAHVCNDAGRWGRGFVLAVSARWPQPEREYRDWYRGRAGNDFGLGAVQLVRVQPELWVANMVGQYGTAPADDGRPPVRYWAVRLCLDKLATAAYGLGASVHMPRIGCGLAGGSWDRVGPLVDAALGRYGVPVTVYDLPANPDK